MSDKPSPPTVAPIAPAQTAWDAFSSPSSNHATGLTSGAARARLELDGPNEVAEEPRRQLVRFARKFWGLSAWMIELIAVLVFALHKTADFYIALSLLVVNAMLSFLQEQHASAAVGALRRRLQVTARALRDGNWRALPAREIVAGDVRMSARETSFQRTRGSLMESCRLISPR